MTRPPASARLLARLRAEGVIPAGAGDAELRRVFPSWSQRVCGAWSWCATWNAGGRGQRCAGSQYSMAQCLAAPAWVISADEWGDIVVDPCPRTDSN